MNRRFEINDMIGEYRVTGFLGEGGMGVVYRGVHEKLGRAAAIKILNTAGRDDSFTTRFFNEARLQAGLHHPNIATLYDFREEGDHLFIFMELVDGDCLGDLIEQRSFTIDQALDVFASICEAIAYVHRNGVIHRDIKAQNAKLTSAGIVKLLDFGIAKDSSSQGLTQTGGVIGTPNYLSPEQLDGHGASPQTDIWALGVLLYEMLTGDLPFRGDTLGGLVLRITRAEFEPAERVNPAVPRDVSAIVARCLKRDPAARFGSVDDILNALKKATSGRHDHGKAISAGPVRTGFAVETASANGEVPVNSKRPFPIAIAAGIAAVTTLLLLVSIGTLMVIFSGAPAVSQASLTGNISPVTGTKGDTRIRVDVDEGKAEVERNGQRLGTTPLDLDTNLGDKFDLTLKRPGFEDKNVNIEVTSGKKVFTFSLKAK